MPGLSKVIVVDPNARARRQVQLGFEREGVPTVGVEVTHDLSGSSSGVNEAGLFVVGGVDGQALDLVRRTRRLLEDAHLDTPIVFAGRGVHRNEAQAAGADEVVQQPAYLRDVVTIGRLLCSQPAKSRDHIVGSLVEITGVFTLVRALSALGRSAVLTLIRGLRRGEIRFFHGEVTSAQVGLIHGQAALHQLLLWTDARFDYHHEDVVRRQQIPLTPEELFADAERFLAGVRDSAGRLSPSMVLEQDIARVQSLGRQIPSEVHGVLRMFDGHRVLADVLEDSPYRVFETLRVSQRALEAGLLRIATHPRPRATWRAVLAIEEWLVGADSPAHDGAIERNAAESGPLAASRMSEPIIPTLKGSRRRRKKKRANTPVGGAPASAPRSDIDWGALVPRSVGQEVGPLAGVVPASETSGEIVLPPRERLEAVMDTGERDRIFPSEASVVIFDDSGDLERVANEQAEAAARDQAEVEVADTEEIVDIVIPPRPEKRAEVEQFEKIDASSLGVPTPVPGDEAASASQRPVGIDTVPMKPPVFDSAPTPTTSVPTPVPTETSGRRKNRKERRAEARARKTADAEAAKRTSGEMAAVAASVSTSDEAITTTDVVRKLMAEEARAALSGDAPAVSGDAPAVSGDAPALSGDAPALSGDAPAVSGDAPAVSGDAPAVSGGASSEISDAFAKLLAVPEPGVAEKSAEPPPVAETAAPPVEAAPTEISNDETSDGVIREIATVDTAPVARRPPPPPIPEDDRPEDTKGEINAPGPRRTAEQLAVPEPSILVSDLGSESAPVKLAEVTANLATAHAAATAAAARPQPAPTVDAATPARDAAVEQIQHDAHDAFSEAEKAFFEAGQERAAARAKAKQEHEHETFDDLDEGYQPVGFWDRLLGRKPPKPPAK